jgi:hypothetical protein
VVVATRLIGRRPARESRRVGAAHAQVDRHGLGD